MELIALAARLMHQDSLEALPALQRAAKRLDRPVIGPMSKLVPEVRMALATHLALFAPIDQGRLAAMRSAAIQAMHALRAFHPRLIGALYDGQLLKHSQIHLQCLCEDPDQLYRALLELKIPTEPQQAPTARGKTIYYQFRAGEYDYRVDQLLHGRERTQPNADAQTVAKWLV